MVNKCFWEHNGDDTLLWSTVYIGAYTRGKTLDEALGKMSGETESYCRWRGCELDSGGVVVAEEKESMLTVSDADSDAIFNSERIPLLREEYCVLRDAALKSAKDFYALYNAIPDKKAALLPQRDTFYGQVPRTAEEMYLHTKNVNSYYFGEIGILADNDGLILDCRSRGFEGLEKMTDYLDNRVFDGSYGEMWSLRKVLRRFIWHDRIHAKAMWRGARVVFKNDDIFNPFCF